MKDIDTFAERILQLKKLAHLQNLAIKETDSLAESRNA